LNRKQKRRNRFVSLVLFIAFAMSLLFPLPAIATPGDPPALTDGMPLYAGVVQQGLLQHNGELVVQLWEDGGWREAGKLPFGKSVHVQELDLVDLPSGMETTIRLEKSGGGAAHLDAVFLGGAAPTRVNNGGGLPPAKLAAMDNDLINIDEGGVELVFKGCKGSTLTVAARIEPVVISKIPFQFPRINTYRTMSENAAFYSYTPGSAWATLSLGEMLGYVEEREPFFKEYVVPGSGHPPGYVYGWVMNDDENLYVALDFTPDNTVDGELDYAKVYVLTVDGLKEFKVTQSEQTWGRANFTYTDKVNYEHKFYEFVIPLKEIGIADAGVSGSEAQEIRIAFAAYGTAAPTWRRLGTDLAYNSREDNYLCVYSYSGNGWEPFSIFGELVDREGNVEERFAIDVDEEYDQASPSVAYDSKNNRFLVVWVRNLSDPYVYGQFVKADGTIDSNEPPLQISPYSSREITGTAVAYDSVNEVFLAAWDYESSDGFWGIGSRFVDANNKVALDDVFDVFDTSDSDGRPENSPPAVAFDSQKDRFLVVWHGFPEDNGESNIYGQFVKFTDQGEELEGDNFLISDGKTVPDDPPVDQRNPSIAYDSDNHQYLVVWEDYRDSGTYDADIFGCILDADGHVNDELPICDQELLQWSPDVVYGNSSTGFWVVWSYEGEGWNGYNPPGLGGRFVSTTGDLGEVLSHPGPTFDFNKPAAAFNSNNYSFLNAVEKYKNSWNGSGEENVIYWLIAGEPPVDDPDPDPDSLQVVSTNPRDGATGVSPSADITVTFNKAVAKSIYFSDISITTGSTVVDYVYAIEGKDLTLDPVRNLREGLRYTVNIPAASVCEAVYNAVYRNDLADDYSFSFRVRTSSSGNGGGETVRKKPEEQPPVGLTLVDRMPGFIQLGRPVKIDEVRREIFLDYDHKVLESKPGHAPRAYYWNEQAKKWVALASYPAGDGKVKAVNDGEYTGWFNVFGVIQPVFTDLKAGHWAEEVINRMNGLGMIEGYPTRDGELIRLAKAEQNISRVEFALLIYRILNIDPDEPLLKAMAAHEAETLLRDRYSDGGEVPGWAVEMAGAVVEMGLMVDRNGRFEAAMPITRIEAAVMVSNALKAIPGYEYNPLDLSVFADSAEVPEWAEEKVENIVVGYLDGTLRPNAEITRAESLTLLLKLFVQGMGW
jgi:hypothetical protein